MIEMSNQREIDLLRERNALEPEITCLENDIKKAADDIEASERYCDDLSRLRTEKIDDQDEFDQISVQMAEIRNATAIKRDRKHQLQTRLMRKLARLKAIEDALQDCALEEHIGMLEALVQRLKPTFTRFINQINEIKDGSNKLKDFKGRAPSYSNDIMKYHDPFLEMQETVLARMTDAGLISSSVSGMTKSQARQKADLMLMIKTPLSLQSHLENPDAEGQFEGEIEEWVEACELDLKETDDVA
jgi:chromosome segregation ATPase